MSITEIGQAVLELLGSKVATGNSYLSFSETTEGMKFKPFKGCVKVSFKLDNQNLA